MCGDAGLVGGCCRWSPRHDVELTCTSKPRREAKCRGFHDCGHGLGVVDHRVIVSVWSQVAYGSWRRSVERGASGAFLNVRKAAVVVTMLLSQMLSLDVLRTSDMPDAYGVQQGGCQTLQAIAALHDGPVVSSHGMRGAVGSSIVARRVIHTHHGVRPLRRRSVADRGD